MRRSLLASLALFAFTHAQIITLVDEDGNTVINTVDADGDTVPVRTIAATGAVTATSVVAPIVTTAAPATTRVVAAPPPVVAAPPPTTRGPRVDQAPPCTTCAAPPTMYQSTDRLGNTFSVAFVATGPVTSTPGTVPAGTRVAITAFEQSYSAYMSSMSVNGRSAAVLVSMPRWVGGAAVVLIGIVGGAAWVL